MTGDPNQKNKFGFEVEGSFPNPAMNLSRFNERPIALNVSAPENMSGNPNECLFGTNNSAPFRAPNDGTTPFTGNYLLPLTSPLNIGAPSSSFPLPFSSLPSTSGTTSSFPENSGFLDSYNGISHSFTHNTIQKSNPFETKWYQDMNPNYNFPSNTSSMATNANNASKFSHGVIGFKRKTESPPLPPLKQHITEEKMAEHMSRLHISSQTPTSIEESPPARQQRLYMCEEMQRLQTESIIPIQILEKVNRPCTALVPWRPSIVRSPVIKENNNNEEEPDNNCTEPAGSIVMDIES